MKDATIPPKAAFSTSVDHCSIVIPTYPYLPPGTTQSLPLLVHHRHHVCIDSYSYSYSYSYIHIASFRIAMAAVGTSRTLNKA